MWLLDALLSPDPTAVPSNDRFASHLRAYF
jgi:hypothetical protein